MHGLINRAIESFLRNTYGKVFWDALIFKIDLGFSSFEAMLQYDEAVTFQLLDAACEDLDRAREDLLEDLGTYLVSPGRVEALRRLLRFGGVNFHEFLHSLDDLPERAKLAVPDLELPTLELIDHSEADFSLRCGTRYPGFSHVMLGILRTMADDYGALVFIDHEEGEESTLRVTLLEAAFAEGREFDLAEGVA